MFFYSLLKFPQENCEKISTQARSVWVISPELAKSRVAPRGAWAEIENLASYKFCSTTHRISTPAQQSRSLRVL